MTSSMHKWCMSFMISLSTCEEWWRVVKSGLPLFTSRNPNVYRGFRLIREEWRVKTRVRFFTSKTTLPAAGKHIPNGDGRPPEIFLPTHHFAPGNGKKLPQLRAILCHSQAKNGMSLFSTRQDYHADFPETFRHLVCTCLDLLTSMLKHRFMQVSQLYFPVYPANRHLIR